MLPKYYNKIFRNIKLSQASNPQNSANSPIKIPLIKRKEFSHSVSSNEKILAKELKSPDNFSSFIKNSPISDKNLKNHQKKIEDITYSLVNLYENLIKNVKGDEVK